MNTFKKPGEIAMELSKKAGITLLAGVDGLTRVHFLDLHLAPEEIFDQINKFECDLIESSLNDLKLIKIQMTLSDVIRKTVLNQFEKIGVDTSGVVNSYKNFGVL